MEHTGLVFNIQKFCIHDGPGIRTTVFLKGCPLKCRWCANPESQLEKSQLMLDRRKCVRCHRCVAACPNGGIRPDSETGYPVFDRELCQSCGSCVNACLGNGEKALTMEGQRMTAGEVLKEVLKDEVFYKSSGGGVTFSGGEPLKQMDFIKPIAKELRKRGIHTACETAGYVTEEEMKEAVSCMDLFLFDMKHYNGEKHLEGTEAEQENILNNLSLILDSGCKVISRIPVIPGFNNEEADAHGFGRLLKSMGIREVHLLPFHQFGEGKYEQLGITYQMAGIPSMKPEELTGMKEIMEQYVERVQIGG